MLFSWLLAGNVKLKMRSERRGRPEHDELWALSNAGPVIIVDKALFASDK